MCGSNGSVFSKYKSKLSCFDSDTLRRTSAGDLIDIDSVRCVVKELDSAFRCDRCVLHIDSAGGRPYNYCCTDDHIECRKDTRPEHNTVYFEPIEAHFERFNKVHKISRVVI